MPAPAFASTLLGWKQSAKNKMSWPMVPNNADVDNRESLQLGAAMLEAMQLLPTGSEMPPPADPGSKLEALVKSDIRDELEHLPDDRAWEVRRGALITDYSQYAHLLYLDALVASDDTLSVTIGRDYLIKPDVVVGLLDVPTLNLKPILHAAISCKWTIRSDRVQNIRHENNQMVRHRRGRQPHLVAVTAEPLPTRLASIARGTGEVDAVYHLAFEELQAAVDASSNVAQKAAWAEITGQGRLMDYKLLATHLTSW